jgi:hypothetical protein
VTEPGRTRWTDERIADLALGVRDEIRDLRAEMRELRSEMREGFRDVLTEISDGRADIRALYGESALNRRWLVSVWTTSILGFVGLLVEVGLR